ncbi:putative GTPase family protein [Desulfamplus magnetovallimortis]|uniref:Putative GTPase family protein n=1 Tax=Desulfamplus magnetovallimortis TaxID=1246637 RepID=A0A1W1HKR6_9BACT|nr:dynamin family protein [Desulfamplus magnetovallimortis]SLM32972.1 putative GTPase family protein [Desulfamplus magnetovallimortis]
MTDSSIMKKRNTIEIIGSISKELATVFGNMKAVPGMYDSFMEQNYRVCREIPEQIDEGVVRIGVVGAIKSGKTTFVNSLLQEDLLKRGAGLVTSTVTRVKRGKELQAHVMFKSWDDVNQQIENALLFLPDMVQGAFCHENDNGKQKSGFDLRRKSDRQFLRAAKLRLYSDFSVTETGIRPEAALISNAIEGYDAVKSFVQADPSTVIFRGDQFGRHRDFTGVGANAFFVRDVLLEIPGRENQGFLDSMVEIADCQGSDSTDPSHMIRIQEYLISANLLIYIISSRTGLREADLKFIKLIQTMGILNNIQFVLNVDLSEHDTLDDLKNVEKTIRQGLGYFIDNPVIYTFSTLLNLFKADNCSLTLKNEERLKQWQLDDELVQYSDLQSRAFRQALNELVKNRYNTIFMGNHLERLRTVAGSAAKRNAMFMELLSDDLERESAAIARIKGVQTRSKQFEAFMDESIESALEIIRRDAFSAVRTFFDPGRGHEAGKVMRFVMDYMIYSEKYEQMVAESGFHHSLYCMFHDFRVALDLFIATHFTPAVADFINEQESLIKEEFRKVYSSCNVDISNVYDSHIADDVATRCDNPSAEAVVTEPKSAKAVPYVDLNAARRILGLQFPKVSFNAGYSAKIKADAVARFGFYTLMEAFGKILNMLARPARASTLKETSKKIRKELLGSINNYFKVYGDKVENEYFAPLILAVARDFRDKLMEMFQMSKFEGEQLETIINESRSGRKEQLERLEVLGKVIETIILEIENIVPELEDVNIRAHEKN